MPANENATIPLSSPFNRIALSLSGGGFRAAAFSLGIMSYLEKVKLSEIAGADSLLSRVEFVSSASGGTIAASLYGMFLCQGRPFREYYRFFLDKMNGEDLLNSVLEKLNNDKEWDPPGIGKRRNFINAFAKVYDEKLFAGETFNIFWNQPQQNKIAVCFNTTDFYRGLSFRFQTDGDNKTFEFIGNRYVYFDKNNQAYKKIKLADILACSSCFPAGFEPVVFPQDFVYSNSLKGQSISEEELKDSILLEEYDTSKKKAQQPIGFMDGGITDNQGLQSAMLADGRNRSRNRPFDLIIVGDVASYFMDPYRPVDEKEETGIRGTTINALLSKISGIWKKIRTVFFISLFVFVISLAGAILNYAFLKSQLLNNIAFILLGISLTVILLCWILNRFRNSLPVLKRFFGSSVTPQIMTILEAVNFQNNFSEDIINKLMNYLGNTKIAVLEQMVKARAASVVTMTSDVNLKHTRRLIYQVWFDNERWDDRRLYNVIFELSKHNKSNHSFRIKSLSWASADDKQLLNDITDQLQQVAEDARTMGTTLWFAKEDVKEEKLKKVVSCGQFTTCMNLIEYVLSIERKIDNKELTLTETEIEKIRFVKKQLLADWAVFKTDPYFLFNSYLS